MPSVTLPNWTSHLCGSGPEQHGVVDNSWEISKFVLPAIETDSKGYYPSVFKVLKEALPQAKTAFYYNWINLFYPYNKQYLDEVSYLEEDAYVPNYEKALSFLMENRKNPTLVFLYSVHTDHAGHKHKWMSPESVSYTHLMALQLENEYVRPGMIVSHLLNLKKMAVEIGFDVPLYSMTHWMDSEYPKGEIAVSYTHLDVYKRQV